MKAYELESLIDLGTLILCFQHEVMSVGNVLFH